MKSNLVLTYLGGGVPKFLNCLEWPETHDITVLEFLKSNKIF